MPEEPLPGVLPDEVPFEFGWCSSRRELSCLSIRRSQPEELPAVLPEEPPEEASRSEDALPPKLPHPPEPGLAEPDPPEKEEGPAELEDWRPSPAICCRRAIRSCMGGCVLNRLAMLMPEKGETMNMFSVDGFPCMGMR